MMEARLFALGVFGGMNREDPGPYTRRFVLFIQHRLEATFWNIASLRVHQFVAGAWMLYLSPGKIKLFPVKVIFI